MPYDTEALIDDLVRQERQKEENRQNISLWKAACDQAFEKRDLTLSKLTVFARRDLELTGFIHEDVADALMQSLTKEGDA